MIGDYLRPIPISDYLALIATGDNRYAPATGNRFAKFWRRTFPELLR
jgi:hypothetical protein